MEVMGGDGYVGYFGFPAPSINSAGRYNWDKRSWYGDMFTTNYLTTMNAWREIRKAINNDEDPRFSMAQILKVAAMHLSLIHIFLGMALLCRISKKEEREVQSQVSMRELYN